MFRFGDSMGGRAWKQPRNESLAPARSPDVQSKLQQSHRFGSNPGDLAMFSYMPPSSPDNPALVVVLHGCGQTAAGYDHGAGWSTLADRYGFALLVPEQQRSNNPSGCFNWFQPEDTRRGRGEAASNCQMVEAMVRDQWRRSATCIYCRAIGWRSDDLGHAGLLSRLVRCGRYRCRSALWCRHQCAAGLPEYVSMSVAPREGLGRSGAGCCGPSLWAMACASRYGMAAPTRTVIPSNARETLKQWTEVHGLPIQPSKEVTIDSYPRLESGLMMKGRRTHRRSYTIAHMAHGTPLATGDSASECGAAGPFLLDIGISSSYHIAKFFGLTSMGVRSRHSANPYRRRWAKSMIQPGVECDAGDGVNKVAAGPILTSVRS